MAVAEPKIAQSVARSDVLIARLERLPWTRTHSRVAAVLSLAVFFDAYDLVALAVVLPIIFRALNISLITTGLLISLGFVGHLIGIVLFGMISEIRGRKAALIGSLVVMGIFSVACAFAWNFTSLAVFRVFCGIGLGAAFPIAGAMIAELVRGEGRGKISLVYGGAFSLGTVLTPLIGLALIGFLGPEIGWRSVLVIGGLPVLVALSTRRFVPESVRWLVEKGRTAEAERIVGRFEASAMRDGLALPEPEVRVHADVQPTKFGELVRGGYRTRTILCWSHWFLCYSLVSGLTSWLPSFFTRIAHLTPEMGLLATVAVNSCGLVMVYVSGLFLIDRVGRVTLFAAAFAGAAFGAFFGMAFQDRGWLMAFIAACIAQGFSYVNAQGCYVYTPELYPTRMRSWATSAGRGSALIAGIFAPAAVGFLLANYGAGGMFAMFALVSLAGMVIMLVLGVETKGKMLEELST